MTSAFAILRLLVLAALVTPFTAEAQPAGRLPRVGVIWEGATLPSSAAGFGQGLRELGYTEGQNIIVEYRHTAGRSDQFPRFATELIALGVDVLVVQGTVSAQSAKAVTTTVPIVFALAGDPVGSGLVASLARPGGNATGLSNLVSELSGKQLEILKAASPEVSRVGVLYNPLNPASRVALEEARASARTLAVELEVQEVRQPNELPRAFSLLRARRAGALLIISDSVLSTQVSEVSKLALESRWPAIFASRVFPEAGGLFAYGPSFADNLRRAAGYVDKILKGAKPADLPVQQPTKFEFVVNMKTAKALRLNVPQPLLLRADEIIE
jgi:putative ABC transport system substrate-binding protein